MSSARGSLKAGWMADTGRAGGAIHAPPILGHRSLGAVAALISLGLAPAAWAAGTFYVNNSSPLCSDVGPGTPLQPYCTIAAALTAQGAPGTTINVLPGLYREQVTVPTSGLAGSPLVLKALGSPGQPVVVDGTDDFSSTALWAQSAGDVWLAASVTWAPKQVFADDARLTPSTLAPASLPPKSFEYVAGVGLFVNAGGGNPGSHRTQVGHRPYGFLVSGKSWVTIDGFTVTRCDDRCVQLANASSNVAVLDNVVSFSGRFGIQAAACSAVQIVSNVVSDNGDHGIALIGGTTGSTVEGNESFRNALPTAREANGLYLFGAPGNLIQRNRWHDNQDTGEHMQSASNNNLSVQNLSWNNGDHGYDHLLATGNVHIGDVAWGNHMDGFSFEGSSSNNQLFDAIAVENGLTTNQFDLWVDATSSVGFVSNDNLFWNSTAQPPVKFISTLYPSVAAYSAASGQDTRTIQADPQFVAPAQGNFHLMPGSPAIDDANSAVANWPATDAEGHARVDDPTTANRGTGSVAFADRGALEFPALAPLPISGASAPGGFAAGSGQSGAAPTPAGGEDPLAGSAGRTILAVRVVPSPMRDAGQLLVTTARQGPLSVRLLDLGGRQVRNLLDEGAVPAGLHVLALDGRGNDGARLGAGMYFYQIRSGDGWRSGRFVIMR